MFTGIVEEIGKIYSVKASGLNIQARIVVSDLAVGDSISVNGACLTVTNFDGASFSVDVVPETLRRTNLGELKAGDYINLERSLAVGGRFGGHIVQGHIDATGVIRTISNEGNALSMIIDAPPSVTRYIVEKGFITVDGTSLTVVNCDNFSFVVTIIPHTRGNTILGTHKVGDSVNLETDIVSKYIERLSSRISTPWESTDEV